MEREGRRVVVVQKGHEILKRVLRGDFVISMRSFQGGLELSTHDGKISSAYVPITPTKWVVPAYFRWVFKSITYIQALQATSDLVRDGQALRFENFAKVPLPHVPEGEQLAIASFLDHATTRIDTLIAMTERSIELLLEHRTALITAAVTGKIDLRPTA
jgi:type I restriction enzyme S subunit